MESTITRISKPVYYFSLINWLANIAFVVLAVIFDGIPGGFVIVFFIFVVILGVATGAFKDGVAVPKAAQKRALLDYCLIISKYTFGGLGVVSLVSLLIGGGRPGVVDGSYVLVSSSEVVRYISYEWFVFFTVCDSLLFCFVLLYFSTIMALRARALYIIQNRKVN